MLHRLCRRCSEECDPRRVLPPARLTPSLLSFQLLQNDFLAQLREAGAHAKPYQIQGALGKGKFATVYKASLGSDLFALKKVAIFELMSESSRDKCLKEIQLLASLHHPNIIRYEDSYLDLATNELVIVLQWARGGDLKKLIRKVKGGQARIREFSEGMVWKYASELASALAYMHRKRIMHRDLKAANIMLSADNHLLLGDLGLSRFFNPQTMEAFSKVGTPVRRHAWSNERTRMATGLNLCQIAHILPLLCILSAPADNRPRGAERHGLLLRCRRVVTGLPGTRHAALARGRTYGARRRTAAARPTVGRARTARRHRAQQSDGHAQLSHAASTRVRAAAACIL